MWFRRLLTIPLIVIFIVLFIVVLLITQINGTLGNPKFYNEQLRQADMYNFVYDEALPAALDEIETDYSSDIHIDIQAIKSEIVSAARKILPPEWLQTQAESATNTIIPYFMGSTDSFTYTVTLKDRVEKAAEVIKGDILRGDAFTSLYEDGISYAADLVVENLDILPYSLTFSKEEIEDSLRRAIPQDWSALQCRAAVDSVIPYLTGDSDHFTITIYLKDRVDAAVKVLMALADQKLEARFYSLPVCSMAEFTRAVQNLPPESLPGCRPASLSYQGFKYMLNIDITSTNSIKQMIGDKIPDQWDYTDANLLDKLDGDDEQTLADVRGWIKSGYTLTEADLRDKISDTDADLDSIDTVRHRIGNAMPWLWTLWLMPFAFLVLVALLGGRNWVNRLAWALAVLFLTSLAVYIATAVVYSHVAEPRIAEGIIDPLQYNGVGAVMAEKGNEVLHNVISAFVAGTRSTTLHFTIASGIALLGLIVWRVVLPRTRATLRI